MGGSGFATPMIMDSPGVFLKCEFLHPGRSHKARVAQCLIDDAEARGLIGGGKCRALLERTGGNLGVGLALEAKARGYSLTLVTDSGYSSAKKALARRLGATVLEREACFPGCRDNGEAIAELLRHDGDRYHYLNQFGNPANPATHESQTGPQIAEQLVRHGIRREQTVVVVCGLGTGATMRGVTAALRRRFERVKAIGVQPPDCDLKTGKYVNDHPFQGIAVGQAAPFFDIADLTGIVPVTAEDAGKAAEYLLARYRFYVGPSSLANFAALQMFRAACGNATRAVFLTLLFDRGEDYE